MKLIIQNGRVIATATDDHQVNGAEIVIDAPVGFDPVQIEKYEYANGSVTLNPVPAIVSRAQGRLALFNDNNLLATIEAHIATAPIPEQIAYASDTWSRNSPSLIATASAIGLTAAQVDALFIAASEITA